MSLGAIVGVGSGVSRARRRIGGAASGGPPCIGASVAAGLQARSHASCVLAWRLEARAKRHAIDGEAPGASIVLLPREPPRALRVECPTLKT